MKNENILKNTNAEEKYWPVQANDRTGHVESPMLGILQCVWKLDGACLNITQAPRLKSIAAKTFRAFVI